MAETEAYWKLLRADFGAFALRAIREVAPNLQIDWNWSHDLIADRLQSLGEGETQRLVINVPPRSLKSMICSVAFPAWLMGIRPTEAVLCISYAQPLADGFARLTRQIMESDFYRATFSTRVARDKRAVELFETNEGGMRIAASVGGTVTGRGGDTIILDDPMKPDEALSEAGRRSTLDWLGSTLASRPNSKLKVRMLCIMQRLHEEDVAAALIGQGWEVLSLPAIATEQEEFHYRTLAGEQVAQRKPGDLLHPAREPLYVLEDLKRQMGTMMFEAQYQQQPVPAEGNLIKRSWFQSYTPAEAYGVERVIQSWDSAAKAGQHNDYSVCTTWGLKGSRVFLLDVLRAKLEFPQLRAAVLDRAHRFNAERVIIEEQVSGMALVQELKALGFYKVFAHRPKGSKIERFVSVTPMFESGQVLLPQSASWLEDYQHELCGFPNAKHDDQVDSTSQALDWIREAGAEPALITFMRREAEATAAREERTIRLRVPSGTFHVYLRDGSLAPLDKEGTIRVTAADAATLRQLGYQDVPISSFG